MVTLAWTSGPTRSDGGTWVIERFDLSGDAALAVRRLVWHPPEATEPVTLVSVALRRTATISG
jgi:hypothetical protein